MKSKAGFCFFLVLSIFIVSSNSFAGFVERTWIDNPFYYLNTLYEAPFFFSLGDIDNDGVLDAAVATYNEVNFYSLNGDPEICASFDGPLSYGPIIIEGDQPILNPTLFDWDDDGDLDMFIVQTDLGTPEDSRIIFYEHDRNSNFGTDMIYKENWIYNIFPSQQEMGTQRYIIYPAMGVTFSEITPDIGYEAIVGTADGRLIFCANSHRLIDRYDDFFQVAGLVGIGYNYLIPFSVDFIEDSQNIPDLVVGTDAGKLLVFKVEDRKWTRSTEHPIESISVEGFADPVIVDYDGDDQMDLFIGTNGGIRYFEFEEEPPPEPEIFVSPPDLTVSEPDGAETFTLTLSRQPTAPVRILLYPQNRNECALTHVDGTPISGDPTVVLDSTNWNDGVVVTVAAKEDYEPDGDQVTRIRFQPATSADPAFQGMEPAGPTVTVLDGYEGVGINNVYPATGQMGIPLNVEVKGVGFGPRPSVILYDEYLEEYPVEEVFVNADRTGIDMVVPALEWEGTYTIIVCNGSSCNGKTGAITIFDAEAAERMKRKKAIIVAGSGPDEEQGNDLWTATRFCTERAYQALISQGFTHDNILYLSAGPVTGNVDETATRESLEHALRYWAKALDNPNRDDETPSALPAEELVVYMTGHGDQETFRINQTVSPSQQITAEELGEWFRNLQYESPAMPGKLIFVYDACLAGSFLEPLKNPGGLEPLKNPGGNDRYVVTSVPDATSAWFIEEGEISFSGYFWDKVRSTGRLYRSFVSARDLMEREGQHALIDINWDGDPDPIDLNAIGTDILIGRGRIAASDPPEIGLLMADAELNCERSLKVWASGLHARFGIDETWATVNSPNDSGVDPRKPRFYRERLTLLESEQDGVYGTRYSKLTRNGTYRFSFYMKDRKGVTISAPRQAVVHRNCDASLSDVVWILKTLVGIPQPAPDADDFQRMDRDENGRLGLPDVVETLRLISGL